MVKKIPDVLIPPEFSYSNLNSILEKIGNVFLWVWRDLTTNCLNSL